MNRYPSIRPRGQRGFTLIEILVCVTIIIVLAVAFTIGARKWRQSAQAAASVSKLRDIGVSIVAYSTDKDEFPVWCDERDGQTKYWWKLIQESEGNDDPMRFQSPGHKGFNPTDDTTLAETISYGYNYVVMGRSKGSSAVRGGDHVLKPSNFAEPSKILMIADGPAVGCWGMIDGYDHKPDPLRYNGKAAAAFFDGTVRLLDTPKEFLPDSQWFIPIKQIIPR